jgi:ferric iron reductase protein FhuF
VIPILAPLFQGDWAAYGETLACAPRPPADAVPVTALLHDAALLDGVLRRHARHLGVPGNDNDLRAVASAWSLEYLWALLPPVVAAASVLQHGFPVRAEDMAVSLDEDGEPVRFHIAGEGHALPGRSTAARFDGLLWQHLEPLFAAVSRQARLPLKVLWGNTARYLELILGEALQLTGHAGHVAADSEALLHCAAWPDGRANPLHARLRKVIRMADGAAAPPRLHRQCCLSYLLPGQGHCQACPLDRDRSGAMRHDDAAVRAG